MNAGYCNKGLGCAVAMVLMTVLVSGVARASGPEEPWQSTSGRDHPLVGRIWDVAAGKFIDAGTLVQRLALGRFVLLGEKHDNPDHHRLQAWVLRALVAAGRRPAVGFEMFTVDDGPAVAHHVATAPTDAAGLAAAVNWNQSGWPDWAMYQPIAEVALEAGLLIVATNLPQSTVRAVGREGLAALDSALVARFELTRPLPPETHAEMATGLRNSHCGYASEAMVTTMLRVQRARDARMADSLIAASHSDGAVLIAGALHVRNDYGIPMYLAAQTPEAAMLSVAFLEVKEGQMEPAPSIAEGGQDSLPFNYVWFTPRVDDRDPCEKFRDQLEHLRKKR